MFHAVCVPAGHGVVQEAHFVRKLHVNMLSFHRLSETTKVLFGEQRKNVLLFMFVTCEMRFYKTVQTLWLRWVCSKMSLFPRTWRWYQICAGCRVQRLCETCMFFYSSRASKQLNETGHFLIRSILY